MAGGKPEIDHPGVGNVPRHERTEPEPQPERFDPPVPVHGYDRVGIKCRHAVRSHHFTGVRDHLLELVKTLQVSQGEDELRQHPCFIWEPLDSFTEEADHSVGIPLGEGEIGAGDGVGRAVGDVTENAIDDRLRPLQAALPNGHAELLIKRFVVPGGELDRLLDRLGSRIEVAVGVPPPGEVPPGNRILGGDFGHLPDHPIGRIWLFKMPLEQPRQQDKCLGPSRGDFDRRIEGIDFRHVAHHPAEHHQRFIVFPEVDAGLRVHRADLHPLQILGRIIDRQVIEPGPLTELVEMPLGGFRFAGKHEKFGVIEAQFLIIRHSPERFLRHENGPADKIACLARLAGEVVEDPGELHPALVVAGPEFEVFGELRAGLERLPLGKELIGVLDKDIGVPAGLPTVKAGNAEDKR